jgi:septum formation protein
MTAPLLILASESPRRAALLHAAGYRFTQQTPPFDDSADPMDELPPREATLALAERKALSLASTLSAGLVLAADTLVAVDGQRLGKPLDAVDARRSLELLFDRWHEVVTGVCLVDAASRRRSAFFDVTRVFVHRPAVVELDRYLVFNEWRGKAGGYNLAELEHRWRFDVRGDPTTVVGLPMRKLREHLRPFAPLDPEA